MRNDLRAPLESRSISALLGVVAEADGSAQVIQGHSEYLVTVVGPTQPRFSRQEDHEKASIDLAIEFSGRSKESKTINNKYMLFINETLKRCLDLESFPRTVILIKLLIIGDDGSQLSTVMNTCMLAILDAGIPLKLPVPTAVTLFHCPESELLCLDPSRDEEDVSKSLFVFNFVHFSDESLQPLLMTSSCSGQFPPAVLEEAMDLASKASSALSLTLKDVMLRKFVTVG